MCRTAGAQCANGRRPIPSTDELISRQTAFFSQTTIDGPSVQVALSQARIVLVGGGAVADHTAGALAASGMKSASVQAAQFRADSTEADCVLVCTDSPASGLFDAVNSAALQRGWPWIAGRIESGAGLIGPAVIPHQTACYRCFELRRRANLARPDRGQAGSATGGNDAAAPSAMAAAVGGLLVLETMRLISRLALPQTMGAVLRLDFFASGISLHRVLRLPNCPDCGYGRRRLPEVPTHGM